MPFEYRGDIAHADVAFDAFGDTLEEVFTAAAEATLRVMTDDPARVNPLQSVEVHLVQEDREMLLFDFLNDLVFYKDARRLLLRPFRLNIGQSEGEYILDATLVGEELDPQRHRLNTDVKAVTMHRFSLRQEGARWIATVVLDV